MKKKHFISMNVVLILWYGLAMIGFEIAGKTLVTSSFEEDFIFFVMPILALLIFKFREKIGKFVLLAWHSMWLITQFLSHEWYIFFENGIAGNANDKIAYFQDTIKLIQTEMTYIPDVYHTILHVLIIIVLVSNILYCLKGDISSTKPQSVKQ